MRPRLVGRVCPFRSACGCACKRVTNACYGYTIRRNPAPRNSPRRKIRSGAIPPCAIASGAVLQKRSSFLTRGQRARKREPLTDRPGRQWLAQNHLETMRVQRDLRVVVFLQRHPTGLHHCGFHLRTARECNPPRRGDGDPFEMWVSASHRVSAGQLWPCPATLYPSSGSSSGSSGITTTRYSRILPSAKRLNVTPIYVPQGSSNL